MRTKNVTQNDSDDLRPECDLSQLKGGVRGKDFKRATGGTTPVLLEADVAEAFPDAKTVNQALRALAKVAQTQAKTGRARELPNTGLQAARFARQEIGSFKISLALAATEALIGYAAKRKAR